ncbi:hypothetical protein EMMF5_003393 [Cystobasidiomycetes sp. EMM_F5]
MAGSLHDDKALDSQEELALQNKHVLTTKPEILPEDVAAELQDGALTYTQQEHDRVLRKIDWALMPLSAWACGLQYVDKTALGAAATYGLTNDLKFVGTQYSWAVSIFYFGYLVGSPVATRLMQRFHAGKVIGVAFFLWGITLLALTWANGFAMVAAMRFLLGVFEATLAPGLLLITSNYYTQREQPARFGMWTLLNGLLPIPFLVIYYGIGQISSGPFVPWQIIFLLVGLVSSATGILIFFMMPDNPATSWFLNARERAIAVDRVAKAQVGIKNTTYKFAQAKEALLDYRVWLIVLQMFFSQAIGSVQSNFIGIIIKGLGFTALRAQLLSAPNFAMQFLTCIWVSWLSWGIQRIENRRRDKLALTDPATYGYGDANPDPTSGLRDLTDRENLAVAAAATLSFLSCISIGTYVTLLNLRYRGVATENVPARSGIRFLRSQAGGLFINLLAADCMQALGFGLSWAWVGRGDIDASTGVCAVQAIVAFLGFTYKPPSIVIKFACVFIWCFVAFVSAIGPLAVQKEAKGQFYGRAGSWCWISSGYEAERLSLHYLFLFLSAGGQLIAYCAVFVTLRFRTALERRIDRIAFNEPRSEKGYPARGLVQHQRPSTAASNLRSKIDRSALVMLAYPVVNFVVILPLSMYRLSSLSGNVWSSDALAICGSIFALGGFANTINTDVKSFMSRSISASPSSDTTRVNSPAFTMVTPPSAAKLKDLRLSPTSIRAASPEYDVHNFGLLPSVHITGPMDEQQGRPPSALSKRESRRPVLPRFAIQDKPISSPPFANSFV